MCAIAALVSCSQTDEVIDKGGEIGKGEAARVSLTLKGSGAGSRAEVPGEIDPAIDTQNATVNDVTVFFLNGNKLVNKVYTTMTGDNAVLTTTTDAQQVAVIANIGEDETLTGIFKNVNSLATLKAAVTGLDHLNKQKDAKVYMAGMSTDNIVFDADNNGAVTVKMSYVSARIDLVSVSWPNTAELGEYGTNFTITGVYLMKAQTNTHFFPIGDGTTPPVKYIEDASRLFGGFKPWGVAPWNNPNEFPEYTQDVYFGLSSIPTPTDIAGGGSLTGKELKNQAHWYVFDNNLINDNGTALVIEVSWNKVLAPPAEPVTRYFVVYFDGVDKEPIVAGKNYQVSLRINQSFLPFSEGGDPGTDTPTVPTVDANVTVTVETTAWDVKTINKTWN